MVKKNVTRKNCLNEERVNMYEKNAIFWTIAKVNVEIDSRGCYENFYKFFNAKNSFHIFKFIILKNKYFSAKLPFIFLSNAFLFKLHPNRNNFKLNIPRLMLSLHIRCTRGKNMYFKWQFMYLVSHAANKKISRKEKQFFPHSSRQ
jgi:hypothetical protein